MKKMGQADELDGSSPRSRREIGSRIGEVADMYDSRTSAARTAGISTDQLARYISGQSQPTLAPVARLAVGAGVRLGWIWSGEGSKEEPPQASMVRESSADKTDPESYAAGIERALERRTLLDSLEYFVQIADSVLEEKGRRLSSEGKAKIIRSAVEIAEKSGFKVGDKESARLLLAVMDAVLQRGR